MPSAASVRLVEVWHTRSTEPLRRNPFWSVEHNGNLPSGVPLDNKTQLLDLPSELLVLIFEELGGRELRRSALNLTVCRKWFQAAHSVYLSGLETSNIHIYGCDIGDLSRKWSYQNKRVLMHRNTRELRIQLLGHWWDYNSKALTEDDAEATREGNEPPAEFAAPQGQKEVREWQKKILLPAMNELFGDLSRFGQLQRVSLECLLEFDNHNGPQWEYLTSSTIATFLRNLPIAHDLRSLTLDLCSGLNYDEINDAHICEEVAQVLPRIEDVRIRLRLICPSIFELQETLQAGDVRLKRLVIKLHLPAFRWTNYCSKYCTAVDNSNNHLFVHESIVMATQQFLSSLGTIRSAGSVHQSQESPRSKGRHQNPQSPHGMEVFRISYVGHPDSNICTVDCVTMCMLYIHEAELYAYEDEAEIGWFEDHESPAVGGPFDFDRA